MKKGFRKGLGIEEMQRQINIQEMGIETQIEKKNKKGGK